MRWIVLLIFMLTGCSATVTPPEVQPDTPQEIPREVQVADRLYLQACGGNPQNYSSEPKVIEGLLQEVPNVVTSKNTSPYGRPFTTLSRSKINAAEQTIDAELINFRDFKVYDKQGLLYSREVTGATSIYELTHQGKVYGWALGWHKRCYTSYEDTEFTVLRVIVPVEKDGKITIQDKVLTGAYISDYSEVMSRSLEPVIMESDDIYSAGATSCYYCLPRVYKYDINSGLEEIKTTSSLSALGIDLSAVNPLIYVSWLSQYGLKREAFTYVAENFRLIYDHKDNPTRSWTEFLGFKEVSFAEQNEKCRTEIFSSYYGEKSSLSAMGWACFPTLQYLNYFEDLSEYRD